MKPLPHKAPQKPAPPTPGRPHFSNQQVSEDTERSMTGRPQKFGAAMPDDEPTEGDMGQPGEAPATSEDQGLEPEQPGNEEGMEIPDPSQANSREEAEAQANDHIGQSHGAEKMVANHHGHLHDLHKRLKALEDKSGGAGHEPSSGSGPGSAMADEDGY